MRISFDFATVNVIHTKSKSKPLALRSASPILTDDVTVKPGSGGLSTYHLTVAQAAAFEAATATVAGIVAISKAGHVTLPDSRRGAPTVVGTSLADILKAAQAAEAAKPTAKAAKPTAKAATVK